MRRQNATSYPDPRRRRLTLVLSLVFLGLVAVPSIALSRLYGHMEALSVDARNGDADLTLHELNYRAAAALIANLPNGEDKAILETTMNVIPKPNHGGAK